MKQPEKRNGNNSLQWNPTDILSFILKSCLKLKPFSKKWIFFYSQAVMLCFFVSFDLFFKLIFFYSWVPWMKPADIFSDILVHFTGISQLDWNCKIKNVFLICADGCVGRQFDSLSYLRVRLNKMQQIPDTQFSLCSSQFSATESFIDLKYNLFLLFSLQTWSESHTKTGNT